MDEFDFEKESVKTLQTFQEINSKLNKFISSLNFSDETQTRLLGHISGTVNISLDEFRNLSENNLNNILTNSTTNFNNFETDLSKLVGTEITQKQFDDIIDTDYPEVEPLGGQVVIVLLFIAVLLFFLWWLIKSGTQTANVNKAFTKVYAKVNKTSGINSAELKNTIINEGNLLSPAEKLEFIIELKTLRDNPNIKQFTCSKVLDEAIDTLSDGQSN